MHKGQLASDRTSCRSPLANQMRLILHTAAYWLMLTLRDAIPKAHALAKAEFATIRLRLIKLGARVIETASRIRLAFAAACPEAALIRHLATTISPQGREGRGRRCSVEPAWKPTTRRKSPIHNALRTTQRPSAFSKNQPSTPARW